MTHETTTRAVLRLLAPELRAGIEALEARANAVLDGDESPDALGALGHVARELLAECLGIRETMGGTHEAGAQGDDARALAAWLDEAALTLEHDFAIPMDVLDGREDPRAFVAEDHVVVRDDIGDGLERLGLADHRVAA